jgi:hypothetical protein
MDIILSLCFFMVAVFFAYRANRSSKEKDSKAIEKEVENDFKDEFEQKTVNELSVRGMSDLVDWMEDDLRERKLKQSKEIESFNELK